MSRHTDFRGHRLKVFTLASKGTLTDEQVRMSRLLRKFRIQAEVVVVDSDHEEPSRETRERFAELTGEDPGQRRDRSNYFLRLGELVREHSSSASFVVVSLPVPRFSVSPRKYMAYLDMLTQNAPPTLLLRGNQESVLTFST